MLASALLLVVVAVVAGRSAVVRPPRPSCGSCEVMACGRVPVVIVTGFRCSSLTVRGGSATVLPWNFTTMGELAVALLAPAAVVAVSACDAAINPRVSERRSLLFIWRQRFP